MRTFISILALAVLITMTATTTQAQSSEKTYFRGGYSDHGFAAIESIVDDIGFSIGWHVFNPSIINSPQHSVDLALNWYSGEYYLDGWYTSVGWSSANAVRTKNGSIDKLTGTLNFIVGYRFGGEVMDLKLGAGYLYSKVDDGIAIDLTIGLSPF